MNKFNIDDCHRMDKSKKTTIVRFVNRKNCKAVLGKKFGLNRKLDNEKLGFQWDARIFVSKNVTPYEQHLAWKCRELKQAGKILSCWSAKEVVKFRRTMNKRPIAIDIALLWHCFFIPRFCFQSEKKIRVSCFSER